MQNIENIIFDLGGVILNIDNKRTENDFVALGAKNFGDYFGHGFAASFFREYEIGMISDQQFIDDLKKMMNLDLPDQIVVNTWNAMLLDFPPERIELLHTLRKKYRLFLFSNTNALHMEAVRKIYRNSFANTELDDHFEKAYYSHILKMRKPDKESFQYIIRENALNPELTLFVDDALVNINGAESAGLRGFYLPPGISITDIKW
jgi:HAD superfamily hydrolase (TIGR01509 family)